MENNYLSMLIFVLIAVVISIVPIAFALFFSPRKPSRVKNSAYECGFPAIKEAQRPFHVRFILIALLFLLFDVETLLIFPWCVSLRHIGWFGFSSMMLFILILFIGLLYEWKVGALKWA